VDLRYTRGWLVVSDHLPVGGLFSQDLADSRFQRLSVRRASKQSGGSTLTTVPNVGDSQRYSYDKQGNKRYKKSYKNSYQNSYLIHPVLQDGNCFLHALKEGLSGLKYPNIGSITEMRNILGGIYCADGVYIGADGWAALASHYGITLLVHEFHFQDGFSYGKPSVMEPYQFNPGQALEIHMTFLHALGESEGHMDLMIPVTAEQQSPLVATATPASLSKNKKDDTEVSSDT
jgi:hypothetical protein